MNNYEKIKQMTVDEMTIMFRDFSNYLIAEIKKRTNLDFEEKPNYIQDIKQWLLQEEEE